MLALVHLTQRGLQTPCGQAIRAEVEVQCLRNPQTWCPSHPALSMSPLVTWWRPRILCSCSFQRKVCSPGRRWAGRNTHFGFFQWWTTATNNRGPQAYRVSCCVVEHSPNNWPFIRSDAGWRLPARADRPISSVLPDPGSNPSKHKLLTPPPKCGIQFQEDRGLNIRKSVGGSFCRGK